MTFSQLEQRHLPHVTDDELRQKYFRILTKASMTVNMHHLKKKENEIQERFKMIEKALDAQEDENTNRKVDIHLHNELKEKRKKETGSFHQQTQKGRSVSRGLSEAQSHAQNWRPGSNLMVTQAQYSNP